MLTDAHKQQYHAEGYTLVKGLVPAAALDAVRSILLEFESNDQGWPGQTHFQVLDPRRYSTPQGNPIPAGVQRPASISDTFHAVAHHDKLRTAMQDLLDAPVELFTDQALIKWGWIAEAQGGCSYFHQDSYYWRLDPELGANCWIPLDPVDKDAIALAIMPGSHRDWSLLDHEQYYDDPPLCACGTTEPFKRHRIPESRIDYEQEVLVPMEPGDGLFFTNFTWHRSEPNHSGSTKMAYAIAYRRAKA